MIRDMHIGISSLKIYYLPRRLFSRSRISGSPASSGARTAQASSRPSSAPRATWLQKLQARVMTVGRRTSSLLELFYSSCTLEILPSKSQQSPTHTTSSSKKSDTMCFGTPTAAKDCQPSFQKASKTSSKRCSPTCRERGRRLSRPPSIHGQREPSVRINRSWTSSERERRRWT